jgi:hypothetical protein
LALDGAGRARTAEQLRELGGARRLQRTAVVDAGVIVVAAGAALDEGDARGVAAGAHVARAIAGEGGVGAEGARGGRLTFAFSLAFSFSLGLALAFAFADVVDVAADEVDAEGAGDRAVRVGDALGLSAKEREHRARRCDGERHQSGDQPSAGADHRGQGTRATALTSTAHSSTTAP